MVQKNCKICEMLWEREHLNKNRVCPNCRIDILSDIIQKLVEKLTDSENG